MDFKAPKKVGKGSIQTQGSFSGFGIVVNSCLAYMVSCVFSQHFVGGVS